MNIRYQTNCENINWDRMPELLHQGGMSSGEPEVHKKTFKISYSVLFAFDDDELIGFGRLLSDGLRQSAIYDIVVDNK